MHIYFSEVLMCDGPLWSAAGRRIRRNRRNLPRRTSTAPHQTAKRGMCVGKMWCLPHKSSHSASLGNRPILKKNTDNGVDFINPRPHLSPGRAKGERAKGQSSRVVPKKTYPSQRTALPSGTRANTQRWGPQT